MIPADVDMTDLHAQIADDGIAFGTDNPVNEPLEKAMRDALAQAPSGEMDPTALVVLENTPPHIPDLRDVAQDLLLESDYETVIVRTPHIALAVSDSLDRAAIDKGQRAMVAEPDYPQGVIAFAEAVDTFSIQWAVVAAVLLIGIAAVAGATFWATRRHER